MPAMKFQWPDIYTEYENDGFAQDYSTTTPDH